MDKPLEELLNDVKSRVEVLAGENPILNVADAIRLAQRNDLLYRYAQNGATWEIRWSVDHDPQYYQGAEVTVVICKHIIKMVPVKEIPAPVLTEEEKAAIAKAKEEAAKKKAEAKAAKETEAKAKKAEASAKGKQPK